jgi:hypothetical protein
MENEMTRISRLKEYAKPLSPQNWQGCSRDQNYIDRWSDRAEANSQLAPRASDKMRLQKTGKRVELRDSSAAPKVSRKIDNVMKAAKADVNHVGSLYMRNVRRET